MVAVTAVVEDPAPIGQTVGGYTILRKLSTGGMGVVYYAEHALIGRAAAVKVLHPELGGSKELVNRFFNEAKATTSIHHPGIVEVFDYGYLPSGHGYIIMELLEGMSLARRIKHGRYSEGDAAVLIRGVCSALAAAHAKGIVHRDLKPDNIFLVDDAEAPIGERPKLLDFGIAKLTDSGIAGAGTKTGAVMGTPTYMSPEQCRGTGNVDHRADLYSLGCILYELSCGRPPFKNLGAGELIGAHQHLQPSPPSKHNPAISPEMEALVVSLLEKDPARRVQSATELAQRLAAIAASHGHRAAMAPSDESTGIAHGTAQSLTMAAVQPPRRARWKIVSALAFVAVAVALLAVNAATSSEGATTSAASITTSSKPEPIQKRAEGAAFAAMKGSGCSMPVAPKSVEPQPVEPQPVEPQPVEPTPVETKPVETKGDGCAAPVETEAFEVDETMAFVTKPVKRAVTKRSKPTTRKSTAKPAKPTGPIETDI